ncbi:acyl-coenzyme A thioesterase 13-like [Triticum dicoccoides]|uniref:acyl-coenzyme A thioesterase 13-like n=1 Tax=Triticum dicoccoides TaxID=85692 RepID=UPI00188FB642|nr:acyl-coenzyme A thioesterase 13-like [Triticum dicoccoides]XP_037430041.1 acyl-coenzyme A thioesterase 13-like [Triticum dicoccoides]
MVDSPGLARAHDVLRVSADNRARVDALSSAASAYVSAASPHLSPSFFEGFALRRIRVLSVHPGIIHCSYHVPPSLTDSSTGCLAAGVVVALVDEIGYAAAISHAQNFKVSVDMSVAFPDLSQARAGDRLSITARVLGHKGAYSGTHVLLTNASTGNVVAEGRHSIFGNLKKAPLKPAATTSLKSNL